MKQIRRFFAIAGALPVCAAVLVGIAATGCSDEKTLVAEGDPVARRKNKDEALNKMLNPNGESVAPSKSKKSAKDAAREAAIDKMHLP
jgi:hypothetical protein